MTPGFWLVVGWGAILTAAFLLWAGDRVCAAIEAHRTHARPDRRRRMNILCSRCRSGAHTECFGGGCECQACAFLRTGSPDDHIVGLHAQIRDLLEEREELLTEIRRLRMGNHLAGRALRPDGHEASQLEPTPTERPTQ